MATALFGPADRPLVNLGLFVATLVSACGTFYLWGEELWRSVAFGLAALTILGAHEMGHYVLARLHGVDASLPYFLPLPVVSPFGTLGAVIRIRGRIPTLNALVDIGAAGPLAGLAVAIPVLLWGFAHSELIDAPPLPPALLGETSGWALLRDMGEWLVRRLSGAPPLPEAPVQAVQVVFVDSPLMLGLRWLVMGPLPPGKDVLVHPVVIAGWFGLLVTMLNLMPIGQLDGGHLAYALFGRRARAVGKAVAAAMVVLCVLVSAFWAVWLLVTAKLIGFGHPSVLLPEEPLSPGRKLVCVLCFLALAACLLPVPLRQVLL